MDDSDRKDLGIGATDEEVGRFLYGLGAAISDALGRGDEWEEGTDKIAGDAPDAAVGGALHQGILASLNVAEKKRAFREYHEQAAAEAGDLEAAEPLIDVREIENEAGEHVGLHVLHSAPDASVYAGDDHVLVITAGGEAGREHQQRIDVPFEAFRIEHLDAENVTEFKVRRDVEAPSPAGDALAEEVVLDNPGRAILAGLEADAETGYENLHLLTAELLKRDPSWGPGNASGAIEGAIGRIGLERLEDRYDRSLADADVREQLLEIEGVESADLVDDREAEAADADEAADEAADAEGEAGAPDETGGEEPPDDEDEPA